MRRNVEDEQTIRRYLLDDLSPEERRRLEERLLDDDDDFYEQLQLAEAELTDDYVTGDLSADERARFKESFLSTAAGHEQLRFTELLREHFVADGPLKKTATSEARPPLPWPQRLALMLGLGKPAVGFALACGLIVAVAAAALLGLRAWQLNRRLERLQAQPAPAPAGADSLARLRQELEEESARRESAAQALSREQGLRAGLEQEVARLRAESRSEVAARPPTGRDAGRPTQNPPRGAAGTVLALLLTSGGTRDSGEMKTLPLTREATTARLRLDIGSGDYKSFRAALQDASSKPLLTRGALRPKSTRDGREVIFDVPARLLRGGGDFQVQLSGVTRENVVEEIGRYDFRVVPR